MRTARPAGPSDRFLGVRLTQEEVALLDRWKESSGSPTRSDAIRALVRGAERPAPETPELPTTVRSGLEQLVEDGIARDLPAAFDLVLTRGLEEVARVYHERLPALRRAAREASDRSASRHRADREGRRLLDG